MTLVNLSKTSLHLMGCRSVLFFDPEVRPGGRPCLELRVPVEDTVEIHDAPQADGTASDSKIIVCSQYRVGFYEAEILLS